MKSNNIFLIAAILFLLASCNTSYRISSDYEKGVDFSSFKTYHFLDHEHGFPIGANPINKQRIERAVESELKSLGYETAEKPDLLVAWFVAVRNVRSVDIYRDYYRGWRYIQYATVYEYKEGTLVIDIIDRANKQVIWHGKTSGQVYEDMPDVEGKINEAVKAMIKKYAKDAKLNQDYATR
ncbi:MAG: hypothetical protein ACI8P3_003528 [Saprospiraceae bacterium]|jgi:hypothetical protein